MTSVIHGGDLAILVYFLALNSFYALLLLLSIPEIWEQTRLAEDEDFQRLMQSDALPPISILVPAHNESATIKESVTALLTLEYRNFEIIVVNDGSKDDTLEQLRHAFGLYEVPRTYPDTIPTKPLRGLYRSRSRTRLLVIDKENGGKADSLNAAINASRFPLVIAVDADTLIEPDAMLRLTRPFLLGRHIAAVGGTVRVANGCTVKDGRVIDARLPRRFLPGVQVVEYLRAFLFGRLGWNRLGGTLIISGAFGLFRKEYLLAIGGYRVTSVVEDLDLVVRLHRYLRHQKIRYEIPFIPDPVAWTEVPETTRILSRQRERWHRGLIAAMWQYRGMLFNPRYGRVGLIAMPFFTFGEMLAPVIEVTGYVTTIVGLVLHAVDVSFALLFVMVAWGYGMLLSLWAVVLEEVSFRRYRRFGDLWRLLEYASLENFGYRQRTVWWRLKAFWSVFRQKHAWGEMVRKGFESAGKQVTEPATAKRVDAQP
ncbi:MAG TPA: glycosyltransferase [Gemmatimonadales bacterium]|nr:glycosyltransferase [Gemmatimonadales bacterium]